MDNEKSVLAVGCCFVVASVRGGGGGSSATLPVVLPFTSFTAIQPSSTTTIPGLSQETTYIVNLATNRVTGLGAPGAVTTSSSLTHVSDAALDTTAVTITTPTSTVSFNTASGDTFANLAPVGLPHLSVVYTPAPYKEAVFMRPSVLGWDYQTFGIWATGQETGTVRVGVMSFGAATPAAALPAAGSATFTGRLMGHYVRSDGMFYYAFANTSLNANFATRNIAFASSSSQTTPDLLSFTANTGLNLSGNLSYAPGVNSFTGTLTSQSGTMSGPATGRFYGPAAEEIGGVFSVKAGAGIETFGGGFGGKR